MRHQLFESIGEEEARVLLSVARRRRFKRNEVIFHEGDPGETLHIIDSGHVAVRVTTPLGDTATLRILGPGAFFGELAVVSPAPRNATVTALDPVTTLSLHREQLDELRDKHRSVDRFLLDTVVAEVRRLSVQLLDALYVPVPKRILRRLLEVADLYASGPGPVVLPLTQDDIAGLAGTSRPTANKVLRESQDKGVLDIARGRVTIVDRDGLAHLGR